MFWLVFSKCSMLSTLLKTYAKYFPRWPNFTLNQTKFWWPNFGYLNRSSISTRNDASAPIADKHHVTSTKNWCSQLFYRGKDSWSCLYNGNITKLLHFAFIFQVTILSIKIAVWALMEGLEYTLRTQCSISVWIIFNIQTTKSFGSTFVQIDSPVDFHVWY